MTRYKGLLISTIIFFLLVNTRYYWEIILGVWNLLVMLVFGITFIILLICLLVQSYKVIRERLKNKPRIYLIITMTILLGSIAIWPAGIIDFEQFEGKDLFIAWRVGSGNCSNTLKLKENHQFYFESFCFGMDRWKGTYTINNDTVKLKFTWRNYSGKQFKYGVYKEDLHASGKIIGEIRLFSSVNDSIPFPLVVVKNQLFK